MVITTIDIEHGFGRKVDDISTAHTSRVITFNYLAQTFGLACGALGRVSSIIFAIGLLVWRQWHKIVFWGLVALQLI